MNELLLVAFRNLKGQKWRTGLTLLGVVIGIATIVAMISIGEGMEQAIVSQIESLGSNFIIVMPAGFRGPGIAAMTFTDADIAAVERATGLKTAAGAYAGPVLAKFGRESEATTFRGVKFELADDLFESAQGFELSEGRWGKEGSRSEIVIGYKIHNDLFSKNVNLHDRLEINDRRYEVVGIMGETGSSETDNLITADIRAVWDAFDTADTYKMIFVIARDGYDPAKVAENIERSLGKRIDEDYFDVMTTAEIVESIGEITQILNIVLGGIAAISLLVAGIGIMNTMVMTIIERTKEIGIMKAIGATRYRIVSIFLTEAAMIGVIGGIIGVMLGTIVSYSIESVAGNFGFSITTHVSPFLAAGAFVFAIIVSTISGLYPAYRAAKLDPIKTLHYE